MAKESDIKQHIESSLAALDRLRDRRNELLEEIQEIDASLERLQKQIAEILGRSAAALPVELIPSRLPLKRLVKKDDELTVDEAVLQVIRDARREINKSDIRIRAMRLAGPFSESALNAALSRWVDDREIRNTSRGFYSAG